jgi:hypothetical protein
MAQAKQIDRTVWLADCVDTAKTAAYYMVNDQLGSNAIRVHVAFRGIGCKTILLGESQLSDGR